MPLWYTTPVGGGGITDVVASVTVADNFPIVGDWFENGAGGSHVGVACGEDGRDTYLRTWSGKREVREVIGKRRPS